MNPFYDDTEIEVLQSLQRHSVNFVVVGGAAVQFYGFERSRGDLDILIEPTTINAKKFSRAVHRYHLIPASYMSEPKKHVRLDKLYIDCLSSIDGVDYNEASDKAELAPCADFLVPVISRELLIRSKAKRGSEQDLADIAALSS